MPNPGEIANLGKFQMFLEMCEVTKTLGGKLPPGLYLVFDAYSYPVIKSVRNNLLSAQTEIGIHRPHIHMCGRPESRFQFSGEVPPPGVYLVVGSMNIL